MSLSGRPNFLRLFVKYLNCKFLRINFRFPFFSSSFCYSFRILLLLCPTLGTTSITGETLAFNLLTNWPYSAGTGFKST